MYWLQLKLVFSRIFLSTRTSAPLDVSWPMVLTPQWNHPCATHKFIGKNKKNQWNFLTVILFYSYFYKLGSICGLELILSNCYDKINVIFKINSPLWNEIIYTTTMRTELEPSWTQPFPCIINNHLLFLNFNSKI